MSATTTVTQEGPPSTDPSGRHGRSAGRFVTILFERYSGIVVWLMLIVLFGIIEPSTRLTGTTFKSVLSNQVITAIMALACCCRWPPGSTTCQWPR